MGLVESLGRLCHFDNIVKIYFLTKIMKIDILTKIDIFAKKICQYHIFDNFINCF